MKRYEKFVFEDEKKGIKYEKTALKGSFFEFSEGTSGELIIKVKAVQTKTVVNKTKGNVATKTVQTKTVVNKTKGNLTTKTAKTDNHGKNYENPPIPKGYKHIEGEWNKGFVIERHSDSSQFVWVPVGSLPANGTLDGVSFNEKFGRRNYENKEFSESEFNETLTVQLALQVESVKKYGGFYISRYNISNSSKAEPQSVKGASPRTCISFGMAANIASNFENSETVKSHLTFGAEYDSVLEWFIQSNGRNRVEFQENVINHRWGEKNIQSAGVACTGTIKRRCINNIYDFANNVNEWTQEKRGNFCRVFRGGHYDCCGTYKPVACRAHADPNNYFCVFTGFRVALYIK